MDLDSIYLHIHGFNTGFVFYAGDAFLTAWRSKENRPAIWREPARRYKHSVLKLLLDYIIVILLHLNHLESVSLMHPLLHTDRHTLIMDWLLSSVFCQWVSIRALNCVAALTDSVPHQPGTGLGEATPSICLLARSVSLTAPQHFSAAYNHVLFCGSKSCWEYLEVLFCLRLRFTAWWASVWGSCAPHCTFLTSWGWRSGPALSTRWSTALTSW